MQCCEKEGRVPLQGLRHVLRIPRSSLWRRSGVRLRRQLQVLHPVHVLRRHDLHHDDDLHDRVECVNGQPSAAKALLW